MKRLALLLMLALALAPAAWAKNLTTENVVAIDSDSWLAGMNKHTAEFARVYEKLNELYRLQAAATCPSVGNATNDLCLLTSTSPPTAKYWDGDSWETLLASATPAYNSGLLFEAAKADYQFRGPLERDGDSTDVILGCSALAPCTIDVAGEILQATTSLKVQFGASAAGTYYIRAARTGTTTTFTLVADAAYNASYRYLAEAVIDAAHVPVRVLDSISLRYARTMPPLSMFTAYRLAAENRISSYQQLHHDTEVSDVEGLFASSTFSPTRRGWYEISATETLTVSPDVTVHCLKIVKGGVDVAETCAQGRYAQARGYFFANGTTDVFTVYSRAVPNTATATPTDDAFANGFWGRWIGDSY